MVLTILCFKHNRDQNSFFESVLIKRQVMLELPNIWGVLRGDLWVGTHIIIIDQLSTFPKTGIVKAGTLHHGHLIKVWSQKIFGGLSGQVKRMLISEFVWPLRPKIFNKPQHFPPAMLEDWGGLPILWKNLNIQYIYYIHVIVAVTKAFSSNLSSIILWYFLGLMHINLYFVNIFYG